MTNDTTPESAEAPEQPVAEDAPHKEKPTKKNGPVRWWFLAVVVLLVGGSIIIAQFALGPVAHSLASKELSDRGLHLNTDAAFSIGLLTGAVSIDDLHIHDQNHQGDRPVVEWDRVALDIDVLGWLGSGDLIIQEISATGVQGSF